MFLRGPAGAIQSQDVAPAPIITRDLELQAQVRSTTLEDVLRALILQKRAIRMHAVYLIGIDRKRDGDTLIYGALPPPPDDPSTPPESLTPGSMTLSWNEAPDCNWNRQTAELFAQSIIAHPDHGVVFQPVTDARLVQWISQQFLVLAQQLYVIYAEQLDPLNFKRKKISRSHRRATLHGMRLFVTEYYEKPLWRLIVEKLGPLGHSSDEENPAKTGRQSRYFIIEKTWRDDDLVLFLHVLDELYRIYELRYKHSGLTFRLRVHPAQRRLTPHQADPTLPRAFYSAGQQAQFGEFHVYADFKVGIDFAEVLTEARELLLVECSKCGLDDPGALPTVAAARATAGTHRARAVVEKEVKVRLSPERSTNDVAMGKKRMSVFGEGHIDSRKSRSMAIDNSRSQPEPLMGQIMEILRANIAALEESEDANASGLKKTQLSLQRLHALAAERPIPEGYTPRPTVPIEAIETNPDGAQLAIMESRLYDLVHRAGPQKPRIASQLFLPESQFTLGWFS
ncbi:hypothetical protein AURDEDRAFT_131984 [Auricularia subglabra TFB-10046 SS5]|uniref:Uncharacterized protein n=1 Tax=Auricularia subglabra (strain TFB-10046 / SS5) TaxID=717982 RepID=J0CRD3_AURST|nr:hypothetical protein AURDEDRAFT_131984 [Auricularia subglabra TFB-10046 SS5]